MAKLSDLPEDVQGIVRHHARAAFADPEELMENTGPRHVVTAKHQVWKALRARGHTMTRIGDWWGTGHTTVRHALVKGATVATSTLDVGSTTG